MDIVALTRYGRLGASSRVRFLQYLPELERQGFRVRVEPLFPDGYVRALQAGSRPVGQAFAAYTRRLASRLMREPKSLLWVEKEALPWLPAALELAWLGCSGPIVLDYDDAVFHQYDRHSNAAVRALLGNKHAGLMLRAACVVAGNRYIADYAHRAGAKRVVELPSVVDLERYSFPASKAPASSPPAPSTVPVEHGAPGPSVTVGWIGQRSTAAFLAPLAPVLQQLAQEAGMLFSAVGIDAAKLGLPMHSKPWAEESEVDDIRRFDIGIMPLPDGPFERGKCGYKLIQYMACGLPVVASPVGANREIVRHGVNGFLATTSEEWAWALRTLSGDADLRGRMGRAGRHDVEERYSLQGAAPKLAGIFHEVMSARTR